MFDLLRQSCNEKFLIKTAIQTEEVKCCQKLSLVFDIAMEEKLKYKSDTY